MSWFNPLTGASFANWLISTSENHRLIERKLDPHVTSLRDLDDVAPNLEDIANGNRLRVTDEPQRITDLSGWGFVDRGPPTKLTLLGNAVRDAWKSANISIEKDDELARELIVILEASKQNNPIYDELRAFWCALAQRFGAKILLNNWEKLFLLAYLSGERDGYAPANVIMATKTAVTDLDDDIEHIAELVAPGNMEAKAGATKIQNAIRSAIPRNRHRATFCLAITLSDTKNESDARDLLSEFGYPERPGQWRRLEHSREELILGILREYGVQPDLEKQKSVSYPVMGLLKRRKNVILYGPPGTGKTRAAQAVADVWRAQHGRASVFEVTFHPSYGYEDFVWGLRPTEDGKFQGVPGILLNACKEASAQPTLLLIDEINRADTARVFGELITFIELDKRDRPFRIAQDTRRELMIPSNLFVLGTMNTADRSVSLLDTALRRRFAFLEYRPSSDAFSGDWVSDVDGISLANLMHVLNKRLAKIGVEPDRSLGHALLAIQTEDVPHRAALKDRIEHDIYPLVSDYCFSDRSRIKQVLGALVDHEGRLNIKDEHLVEILKEIIQQEIGFKESDTLPAN